MTIDTKTRQRMISRRVKHRGDTPTEAETLLDELLNQVAPQNWPSALLYENFVTQYTAEKMSAAIAA